MDTSIVPAHLAVKAMRDNGYKNAAYAIAELMDNSIQHNATIVELMCSEIDVPLSMRTVARINQIAVLDNGSGMTPSVLQMALQFGNGTHLDSAHQKGIGKFGMGLPSSSISQAQKVEVWTWQNGIEGAMYTFLDIDKIKNQEMKTIPAPEKKKIPEMWQKAGGTFEKSGTLVVWSNIDRCIWKTAQAIIDNSEFLIGRMYRRFLANGKVVIRAISFKEQNPTNTTIKEIRLNDPLYLSSNSSCPPPYDSSPMFEKWGDDIRFTVTQGKEKHEIILRFSIAKKEARPGRNPGSLPHGKHAGKNIGVSILRADRELDLDQAWIIQYDPVERWWGVEVEFPPALDEIFGVTNNKQFANNFTELAKVDFEELTTKAGKTIVQLKQELEEENDPKALLLEVAHKIKTQLTLIRKALELQKKDLEKKEKRYNPESPEKIATDVTEERKKEGHVGTSDSQETAPIDERKTDIQLTLEDDGVNNPSDVIDRLFKDNIKYSFIEADIESHAFFGVKSRGGKIIITLNINHPAYHKLVEVLEKDTENVEPEELRKRLDNASEGMKLLLMAWARYEDEQPDGKLKSAAQDARQDWGRIARQFLEGE